MNDVYLLAAALLMPFVATDLAAQSDPLPLIPYPHSVTRDSGSFQLEPGAQILLVGGASSQLGMAAADLIEAELGWRPDVKSAEAAADSALVLILARGSPAGTSEGYRLHSAPTGVSIIAVSEAGLFYGLQTLRQLLASGQRGTIPAVRIDDAPRFSYRGMHLDVARHMFPVAFVKRYIDLMSRYKFNTFHWHLTDDQGWRIEIKRYPRLTSVGGWRKETIVGQHFDPYVGDGTPYGGFYTQDEIRDVVSYAAARHVTIIPEIEMPGHAQAALAAYPELACTSGPFEVSTLWGVDEDIFCPAETTFAFLQNVLTEVMALFPSRYIHIGGDEAPKKRWRESTVAQGVIVREGLRDEHELQSYFIRRIGKFLAAHDRRLIGWDEILEGGLAPSATVMSWRGMDGGIAAARQGHDVIMTPGSHVYFDHAQGDPALEPLSIGGNTPLDRVYSFEPVPAELSPDDATHVLGAQGNVWTEYIKTGEQVEYMVFPRLLALSEVLWSPAAARDWTSFTARLPAALTALDRMGVNYRVPHVRGLEADRLTLGDTAIAELWTLLRDRAEIRYTLDGTAPTATSLLYTAPLRLSVRDRAVTVTAQAFMGADRASPPRSARFRRTSLRPADAVTAPLQPGLRVAYYEPAAASAKLLSSARPKSAGIATSVGLQGTERAERFGLRFTGFVRIEEAGIYEFTLVSDDGSVLRVGDDIVVDNDGWHSETERSGMTALAAGVHPIVIEFVQGGGSASLGVFVRSEGGEREPLAGSWLLHR